MKRVTAVVLASKARQPERQRLQLRLVDENERERELIPVVEEVQNKCRGKSGSKHGHDKSPEYAHNPAPVHNASLLHFLRKSVHEPRQNKDRNRQIERHIREQQCQAVIHQIQRPHLNEQGDKRRVNRNQHTQCEVEQHEAF
ncbi:hypothetical protein D3C71_1555710 [compost metagenome]